MKRFRFKTISEVEKKRNKKIFKAVKKQLSEVGNILESTAHWCISDKEMGENGDKYMATMYHSTGNCHIIDLDLVDTYDEAVQSIIDWEVKRG